MSELPSTSDRNYVFKEDHRDNTRHKSQWTISSESELACFDHASERGWIDGDRGWGLHLESAKIAYLGVAAVPERHRKLFLAKFVGTGTEWHGYPANPLAHQQDRPPKDILLGWKESKLINMSKLRKIMKGQPCSL